MGHYGAHWSCCLLFTYLFLDSPLVMAVGAADVGWALVVILFLLLLLVMSGLDVSSALHFFTARGFFHHRTAVLLRTMHDRHKDKLNRCWREKTKAEKGIWMRKQLWKHGQHGLSLFCLYWR